MDAEPETKPHHKTFASVRAETGKTTKIAFPELFFLSILSFRR